MDCSGMLNRRFSPSPRKSDELEENQVPLIKTRIAVCQSELDEFSKYVNELEIQESTRSAQLQEMSLWSTYAEGVWNVYFDLNVKLAEMCPDNRPDIDAVRDAYFVAASRLQYKLKINGKEHKPPRNLVAQ
ncbi:hypothetical protein TKK_0001986 [Trichogramma kaykai]